MKGYSVDLRNKVVAYVDKGGSRIDAARIFGIGERTVRRWLSLREETGSCAPRAHGGGYPAKIDLSKLKQIVNESPDKTLKQLAAEFSVSTTSIWKALKKLSYVYKKNAFL